MNDKKINKGDSAIREISIGVEMLADAVSETLGPKGRNVIIDREYGDPIITKDGWTVASHIKFGNKLHNMGATLIRNASGSANNESGDGSTTTIVLTRAILSEGVRNVTAGDSPIDIKRGIDFGVKKVVEELKKSAIEISYDGNEVEQVAYISANNDKTIGKLIFDAVKEVGKDGAIVMGKSPNTKTKIEVTEGVQVNKGFASPYFVTNEADMKAELENCHILLYHGKIANSIHIAPLLTPLFQKKEKVLIIANEIEGEALQSLAMNKVQRGVSVCAVNAPSFGYNRQAILEDIAMSTGATVIDPDKGMDLEYATPEVLGMAKKVIVDKDKTIISGGNADEVAIEDRKSQLKKLIEEEESPSEKILFEDRLTALNGKIATIKIGAVSEVEQGEKKDRIEDALNATKAAMQEGIVSGGGTALVKASKVLDDLSDIPEEFQVGVKILQRALTAPMKKIAENAGVNGSVVVEDYKREGLGYNAKTDKYEDLIKAGVIDPVKVVRTALESAASVAGMILTTSVTINDLDKEE